LLLEIASAGVGDRLRDDGETITTCEKQVSTLRMPPVDV
jgi:hypothetical protein